MRLQLDDLAAVEPDGRQVASDGDGGGEPGAAGDDAAGTRAGERVEPDWPTALQEAGQVAGVLRRQADERTAARGDGVREEAGRRRESDPHL